MLVLGIDPGLLKTGVAALVDGWVKKVFTISVEGDPKDTGPRFACLRRSLAVAAHRLIMEIGQPVVIAVEIPDEDEGVDGIREGHEKMDVAKVYGAYAVLYAEASRLWPKTRLLSVTPRQWKGAYQKGLTERILGAKYPEARCANSHEWDALGLADWSSVLAGKDLTARGGGEV
jgi:hypothetical protein